MNLRGYCYIVALSFCFFVISGSAKASLPIPEGYTLFEKISGDLNGDTIDDHVLIVKDTKKDKIVQHEYFGELDRNRRGILIYLSNNGNFDLVTKNLDCFSSENEDGGGYFAPELSVETQKGHLVLHYGHGKYGYWTYSFRYQNSDFELIEYFSASHRGSVLLRETSINFLTKKKLVRENIKEIGEHEGHVVFEEKREDIAMDTLHKLSEIKDFYDLRMLM